MVNKEAFLHIIGEELERLLKQIETEYEEKINQLLIENKTIATTLEKANAEIQYLSKKNEKIMKEFAPLHQPNSEVEVVNNDSIKGNALTTRNYRQMYNDLERNRVNRENVVEYFSDLLKWNEASKYFDDGKIVVLWSHLLHIYKFTYFEWKESFKDENINVLLFKRIETGARKLLKIHINLKDTEAIKNLLVYLLTQIIKKGRFGFIKIDVLLHILYYDLAKQYLYQKDVREYFLTEKNIKVKSIYESYLLYLKSPSQKTHLKALRAIEKYENLIIQIGDSKSAYLDIVFKEVRDIEKAEQKETLQMIDSQKTKDSNTTNGQLFEMNNKSALMDYGYQISNRTPEQRWRALQKAVPELGLKKVVYIIDNHIKLRATNKEKFSYTLRQWTMDLEKLKKTYFKGGFTWPSKRY